MNANKNLEIRKTLNGLSAFKVLKWDSIQQKE